jgi:hypothetical protein
MAEAQQGEGKNGKTAWGVHQESGIGFNPGPTWKIIEHAELI